MTFHEPVATAIPLLTVLLSLGLVFKAAAYVIRYATLIADAFNLGTFAVGALFVSVATTLPELFVGVIAASNGNTGIALGNIFGSNIANITLLLGVAVLVGGTLLSKREEIEHLVTILFITSTIPIILFGRGVIGMYAAITLLLIFVGFSFELSQDADGEAPPLSQKEDVGEENKVKLMGLFAAAITVLLVATEFFVQGATAVAQAFNVSATVIGLTVVAIGTSLPELSVAINGMRRKTYSVVLGNLIGANIANLTLVLGLVILTHVFSGAAAPPQFAVLAGTIPYLLIATLFLWYRLSNREAITRHDAVLLLGLYGFFLLQQLGIVFLFR